MGSTTTISVDESTLRRFNAERKSDQYEISQDAFLNELLDCWNDQLDSTDAQVEGVAEILRELEKTQELVERVPEDTASALRGEFA